MSEKNSKTKCPKALPRLISRWIVFLALALLAAYAYDTWRDRSAADLVAWHNQAEAVAADPAWAASPLGPTLTEARNQNKPVLVWVTATWCGPCQALKAGVFANQADAAMIGDAFVPLKLEVDTMPRRHMATVQRLGVEGYPTLIGLTPDGKEISRLVGYPGRDRVIDFLYGLEAQGNLAAYNR